MAGKGDCVMEGPMAGMNFRYFKDRIDPHCLFRTFDYSQNRLSGGKYSSSAIDEILKKPDISSFTKSLNSVHASVHEGLGGDMEGFSAPNGELHFPMYSLKLSSTLLDPIFFLHHAQVDRLWWQWQQSHMHTNVSRDFALDIPLAMAGFVKDITSSEALDSNKPPFCYRY